VAQIRIECRFWTDIAISFLIQPSKKKKEKHSLDEELAHARDDRVQRQIDASWQLKNARRQRAETGDRHRQTVQAPVAGVPIRLLHHASTQRLAHILKKGKSRKENNHTKFNV
jgi:hypothetical protein